MIWFNRLSAGVTATVVAVMAFQLALPSDGDVWPFVAAWVVGALAFAVTYGLVRDGVRATVRLLTGR